MTNASDNPLQTNAPACPRCAFTFGGVIDTRPVEGNIRRRRVCGGCGHRFTTRELTDESHAELLRHKAALLKVEIALGGAFAIISNSRNTPIEELVPDAD